MAQSLIWKGIMAMYRPAGHKKTKPIKANLETAQMESGGERFPHLLIIDNVFVTAFFIDFGR